MARWKRKKTATFEDLPERLQRSEGESRQTSKERFAWLESHGLSLVDYFTWLRAQDPLAAMRPPARRKLMTSEQLAELDAKRELEKP